MTEIEPEFDANERDNWYAFDEWESALCPQCGNLQAICSDPESVWNPQITTCYSTLAVQMHNRRWHRKYENIKPDRDGWLPTDGAAVWVHPELPPDPWFGLLGQED